MPLFIMSMIAVSFSPPAFLAVGFAKVPKIFILTKSFGIFSRSSLPLFSKILLSFL